MKYLRITRIVRLRYWGIPIPLLNEFINLVADEQVMTNRYMRVLLVHKTSRFFL
jgi:isoleucyl-tRNA synthetase